MQYYRPDPPYFAGDAMPFFHDGVFHLCYLLDEDHHRGKGGLGGHQWAHASTTDLVHWTHHPLALACVEEDEASICTGSVFWHDGTFHAFYAARRPDRREELCVATSPDGIHFTKSPANPLAVPGPGLRPSDFRDPTVFRDPDTGRFHLLLTANLSDPPVAGRGGHLAQFVSDDLAHWTPAEPFFWNPCPGPPECSEVFAWNGWYYLIYGPHGPTRYRYARSPHGPWRCPPNDMLDGPMARVMKTAAFTGNRRLGVAWVPWLMDGRDDGGWGFGGHLVLRELVQHDDGTLGTRFAPELIPAAGEPFQLAANPLAGEVTEQENGVALRATSGYAVAALAPGAGNLRLTARVVPGEDVAAYGLGLRGSGRYEHGYELRLSPGERRVELRPMGSAWPPENRLALSGVEGLDRPVNLDVVLYDDLIDVCVDDRRTLIARRADHRGESLFLFCQDGRVQFAGLAVRPVG